MPFALHSIFAGVPSVAVTGVVAGARAAHWGASLALVLGGLLVGAAVARALTRREQERLRAVEEREHGMRIRALEMRRLDAVAALGRAAAELAERSLRDAAKGAQAPPRRAASAARAR
jgi:hypothetical protein